MLTQLSYRCMSSHSNLLMFRPSWLNENLLHSCLNMKICPVKQLLYDKHLNFMLPILIFVFILQSHLAAVTQFGCVLYTKKNPYYLSIGNT